MRIWQPCLQGGLRASAGADWEGGGEISGAGAEWEREKSLRFRGGVGPIAFVFYSCVCVRVCYTHTHITHMAEWEQTLKYVCFVHIISCFIFCFKKNCYCTVFVCVCVCVRARL